MSSIEPTKLFYQITKKDKVNVCNVNCEEIQYKNEIQFDNSSSEKISDFLDLLKQDLQFKHSMKFELKEILVLDCKPTYQANVIKHCGDFYYVLKNVKKNREKYFLQTDRCSFEGLNVFCQGKKRDANFIFPQQEFFENLKKKLLTIERIYIDNKFIFYCEELFFRREFQFQECFNHYVDLVEKMMRANGYVIVFGNYPSNP